MKYLMTKKVCKQNCFLSAITNFSNLVISKRWDGFTDEKFWNYAGSLLKIPIYREVHEKTNI